MQEKFIRRVMAHKLGLTESQLRDLQEAWRWYQDHLRIVKPLMDVYDLPFSFFVQAKPLPAVIPRAVHADAPPLPSAPLNSAPAGGAMVPVREQGGASSRSRARTIPAYSPSPGIDWSKRGEDDFVFDDDYRDELFRMRHKFKMKDVAIAEFLNATRNFTRQAVAYHIGPRQAHRTGNWPRNWRASAALHAECGLIDATSEKPLLRAVS